MRVELNPSLDPEALAAEYGKKKRMQIRGFLAEQSAKAVYEELQQLPWGLAYNERSNVVQMSPDQVAALQPPEAARIMAAIQQRSRSEYQFLYAYFPILKAYFTRNSPWFGIYDFYEFLNRPDTLALLRKVTGLENIRWADGQATWFKPGHFLKAHTDEEAATGRLAAYVMNFSPGWERDWGGFLQFFDDRDNIEAAFKPTFNTLNIFTIPQLHSVSMVSTYVTGRRISVTGWLRSDEPPGQIPRQGERGSAA